MHDIRVRKLSDSCQLVCVIALTLSTGIQLALINIPLPCSQKLRKTYDIYLWNNSITVYVSKYIWVQDTMH